MEILVLLLALVAIFFLKFSRRRHPGRSKNRVIRPERKRARPEIGPKPPLRRDNRRGAMIPAEIALPKTEEITGRCWVIDGDTIKIGHTKIRLAGIDAPELDDPFGQKSRWAMVSLCKGQEIRAELTGERSYDRLVATCFLPDGRDIGAELIRQGLALDGGYFSSGKYRHLEPRGIRWKLRHAYIRKNGGR